MSANAATSKHGTGSATTPVSKTEHHGGGEVSQRLGSLKEQLRSVASDSSELVSRVLTMAAEIERLEALVGPQSEPAPVVAPAAAALPLQTRPPAAAPEHHGAHSSFITEFGLGRLVLLLGGLGILIIGVGIFLSYSFSRNWIGPSVRVLLAYGAGAGLLAAGWVCMRRELETFGLSVIGGGFAVLYFAGYAAFDLYHLVGQGPAFAMFIAVTVLAGVAAVRSDSMWLALVGIVGGFATPVVLNTGGGNHVGFLGYILVLDLGVLGVAAYKQWRPLNVLAFAITWVLYSLWFFSAARPFELTTAMIFCHAFFVLFSTVPFVYSLRKRAMPSSPKDFAITVPNAMFAFGFAAAVVSTPMLGALSIVYAGLFALLASYVYRNNADDRDAFVMLTGTAAVFAAVTVPLLLSSVLITVLWALQAVALIWMAGALQRDRLRRGGVALLSLAVAKWATWDLWGARIGDLFDAGFTSGLIGRYATAAVVLGGAWYAARGALRLTGESARRSALTGFSLFALLLFYFCNLEVFHFFTQYAPAARLAAVSILWAVFSLGLMWLGFARGEASLRRASLWLFGLASAKLFLFDVRHAETPFRILSFVGLGLLLVGASYLYHRQRSFVDVSD